MKSFHSKFKAIIGILCLIIATIIVTPCSVFADVAGVTVRFEGHTVLCSEQTLNSIWRQEGSKEYKYSGYNTYASYKPGASPARASGPTVAGILAYAGYDVSKMSEDDVVKIITGDGSGFSIAYTKEQFLSDRYYFKNGKHGTERGKKGDASSRDNPSAAPIIVSTSNGCSYPGQIAPNEQNWPGKIDDVLDGGTIEVIKGGAATLPSDVKTTVDTEQYVLPGQEIVLLGGGWLTKVYYTTDGSEPTINSDIYNYNSYLDPALHVAINAPQQEGATITIKCRKIRYGSKDSPVQTFTYTVNTAAVQRILNDRKVVKGQTYTVDSQKYKVTEKSAGSNGTVTFTKAKKAKTVTVPATVKLADGKTYHITAIGAKAFAGTKATKIILKTKKLKKTSVKGCLKKSKVKKIKVKVGSTKQNKAYAKKYKKIFTKKNAGKKVTVVK